jgi:hypothetical protein
VALKKIQFLPGVDKEGTQFTSGFNWFDSDKIRFRKGRAEKIGGWQEYTSNTFKGICRSIYDWITASGTQYVGLGTNLKFYVEGGGGYNDITPIRATTAAGDVTFAIVGDADATLTVSDTGHGAVANDFVTFSGAVSLGGNITAAVLNQEYQVATIVDADSYTIEAKDSNGDPVLADSGTDTGNGGANVVGAYQINTGTNTYVQSSGFGVGTYGSGTFGGPGALAFSSQLRLYSQDEYGDDLIFCPRGGSIYYWDESSGTGTRAVDLSALSGASNTPTVAFQAMVSPQDRHVIAFGVNTLGGSTIDPLLVRWSDQEDAADWTPTATNTSGGQVLSTGSFIIGALRTRQEILIFTDKAVHSMRFVGAPFVFSFSQVGENASIISPNAAIATDDAVFCMDLNGFYVYRGAINRLPCPVFDHVFLNIDKTQLYKVFGYENPDFNEVTWFYPSLQDASTPAEISRYVTFNYLENTWYIGSMERAAWNKATTKTYPIASGIDTTNIDTNYLYTHEFGYDANGSTLDAYIESGEMSIADGESFAFLRRIIPDFRIDGSSSEADFTLTIKGNDFPLDSLSTLSTATVTSSTKQSHVRARAREIVLRVSSTGTGYGWTMGDFRFDMRTDGKR